MPIYLKIMDQIAGERNGILPHKHSNKTSWDGNTMDIDIPRRGDNRSTKLNNTDIINILGRSCNKTPLEKRLSRILTIRKKTRGNKRKRCPAGINTRRRRMRKQQKSSTRRRNYGRRRSCRQSRRQQVHF